MIGDISVMFSRMIGTLAVILLVAGFIGGSDIISKFIDTENKWKQIITVGLIGGVFGVYGNISGFDLNGAVISVRDIGPMLAGFTGGPIGGFIAGLIAGVHRLLMGGITAEACVVATCCIGLFSGYASTKWHTYVEKPFFALLMSALMEVFHLMVVLIMVKPYAFALNIVNRIAVPFVAVNALGFMLMITIILYTKRQRELSIEKNRLQSELEVASVIQNSLLPLMNEDYPDCKEFQVSASMDAAKEVGGDFYDVFYVDPTHLAFVIGDVSGKGIPAALFMATSKITLQNCIRDNNDLAEAIEIANNSLCARNEAEMFVTIWVGIIDLESGKLTFVNAGHNPPILVHNNEPEYLKQKSGFILAGMEDMIYRKHTIQLAKDDILYLYTDGVTEAVDHRNNMFGDDQLLECFRSKSENTTEEIIDNVKVKVEEFISGNSQFDDMTMLCLRCMKDY